MGSIASFPDTRRLGGMSWKDGKRLSAAPCADAHVEGDGITRRTGPAVCGKNHKRAGCQKGGNRQLVNRCFGGGASQCGRCRGKLLQGEDLAVASTAFVRPGSRVAAGNGRRPAATGGLTCIGLRTVPCRLGTALGVRLAADRLVGADARRQRRNRTQNDRKGQSDVPDTDF